MIIMEWGVLVFACLVVFSVQLGVQTMPNLLSGVLFPSDVRSTLKGITRSIQCVFIVTVLEVLIQEPLNATRFRGYWLIL